MVLVPNLRLAYHACTRNIYAARASGPATARAIAARRIGWGALRVACTIFRNLSVGGIARPHSYACSDCHGIPA